LAKIKVGLLAKGVVSVFYTETAHFRMMDHDAVDATVAVATVANAAAATAASTTSATSAVTSTAQPAAISAELSAASHNARPAISVEDARKRNALDIRERTVLLKLNPRGKPYNSLEMAQALTEYICTGEIQHLGPLGRNAEWYITVDSARVRNELLQLQALHIRNYRGVFESTMSHDVQVKIHWLPPWVDNDTVCSQLQHYMGATNCKVTNVRFDKSTVKLKAGANLYDTNITVRTAIVRVEDKSDLSRIPHFMTFLDSVFNEKHESLITMSGSEPVCLRCRFEGHFRSNCQVPFCKNVRILVTSKWTAREATLQLHLV
jgi:hypothetical protein